MGLVQLSNLAPIITTADAKAHLRLDTDDDDAYVAALVLAATDWLEKQTNLTLTPQQFRLTLDAWPADGTIIVPRPPLVSIDAITIDGQTVDPAGYTAAAGAGARRQVARRGMVPQPRGRTGSHHHRPPGRRRA